jgi:hypothetical protein
MDSRERRIEQLEHELAAAERRVAAEHQKVYSGKRPYDPIRETALERSANGARERLERERMI